MRASQQLWLQIAGYGRERILSQMSWRSLDDPSLQAKVTFLSGVGAFPHAGRIDALETHMAWVFLTEERAYKLKKPVVYDYLDFSTLDARHRDAEAELALNRRMAPDVYLGIMPLGVERDGTLKLGGGDTIVDWLVEMRRLPDDCMLDQRIARGDVATRDVARVAESLAGFHAAASQFEVLPSEYRRRLARDVADALRELSRPELGLPVERVTAVGAAQLRLIDSRPELFDERVRGGHIVEGHGDLRAEHVCVANTIAVIDCLEFNRGFRMLDTASELAFLALECERLGAPKIATALSEAHARALGDRPPALLSRFHEGLHAMVRAKIAVWHLAEPRLDGVEKWLDKARRYLELAESKVLGAA